MSCLSCTFIINLVVKWNSVLNFSINIELSLLLALCCQKDLLQDLRVLPNNKIGVGFRAFRLLSVWPIAALFSFHWQGTYNFPWHLDTFTDTSQMSQVCTPHVQQGGKVEHFCHYSDQESAASERDVLVFCYWKGLVKMDHSWYLLLYRFNIMLI